MPKRILNLLNVLASLFIIDWIIKLSILAQPFAKGRVFINYFSLKPGINSNLALSLPANNLIIAVISLAIIAYLVYLIWLGLKNDQFYFWGLGLILTGAVSNVIDRFVLGGVLDYFNIIGFTSFNFSDCLIFIGAVIVFLTLLPKKQT